MWLKYQRVPYQRSVTRSQIFEVKINEISCEMTVPATTALTSDFISMAEDDDEREEVLTLVSFKAKLYLNDCNIYHNFRGDYTF